MGCSGGMGRCQTTSELLGGILGGGGGGDAAQQQVVTLTVDDLGHRRSPAVCGIIQPGQTGRLPVTGAPGVVFAKRGHIVQG